MGGRAPHYTSSLDAAVAFVSEMLPGWHWKVYGADGNAEGSLYDPNETNVYAFAATPPLALMAAALRALAGEAE